MKFNRLKASIVNNSSEKPSVYMAVCAIESLLRDMEEEAGRPVDQLPAGDEMLSAKLVWLCRVLQKIYTGRSEELQRSRAKLDRAMSELQIAEESLSRFAGEEEKLASLLRRKSELDRELDQAKAANAQGLRVREEIDAAEMRLEQLKSMDLDAESRRLEDLRGQVSLLEGEQRELRAKLEQTQRELDLTRKENAEAEQRLAACVGEKEKSLRRLEELETQTRAMTEETQEMQASSLSLDGQLENLQQQKRQLDEELREKKQILSAYQNREVDPVMEELKKARIEIEAYEEEKGQSREKLQELRQRRDQIVAEIAAMKDRCEEAEKALHTKEEERIKAEGRRLAAEKRERELQEKLDGLRDKLNSLQTSVASLEEQQLPEQQRLTEAEEGRHDRLLEQLNQLGQGRRQLQEENGKLENQVQEVEKDRQIFQKTYDSRVADYKNKSQELRELEEKITELEGKDEVQGYATYKQQLAERIAQMEKICGESASLTGELGRLDRELEEKRAALSELTAKRAKKTELSRELTERQNQLREVASPGFEEELSRVTRRLALISEGQARLSKTLALVREVTGEESLSEQGRSLLQQTGQAVGGLRDAVGKLQTDLKKCAESLEWKNGV